MLSRDLHRNERRSCGVWLELVDERDPRVGALDSEQCVLLNEPERDEHVAKLVAGRALSGGRLVELLARDDACGEQRISKRASHGHPGPIAGALANPNKTSKSI